MSGILQDFGLVSRKNGWVLTDSRLFWTGTGGMDWSDITPVLPSTGTIHAVSFLNAEVGWVLWSNLGADGSLILQLESTSNQGRNWIPSVIQNMRLDDTNTGVEKASMDWLDEKTGWISVKQPTGSNFSSGTLFRTKDGGQTWARSDLPIGEPAYFVNNQVGWLAGGPAGDQLFKTLDGGRTWGKQPVPGSLASGRSLFVYPPVFDSPEKGLLPLVIQTGDGFQLEFYSTEDGGENWILASHLLQSAAVGQPPVSLLDASDLSATIPGSNRIVRMIAGEAQTTQNQDGLSAGIVDLKMLTSNFGWAKWGTAACTKQAAPDGSKTVSCTTTTRLIATRDGGITWEDLTLPDGSGTLSQSFQTTSSGLAQAVAAGQGKTLLISGQGFDICTIPTLSQLQSWWNNSPYQTVNLYIGGSARACPNPALTADYVNQMRQQGWAFIPTWIGPQAPCTTFNDRFSYDVNNAFVQGKDEAYLASARLAKLGLTNADMSGSVVYYDMEGYGSDQACRNAVNAFVNGWVTHLHDLGNLGGIYASTLCKTGLSDYLTIPNIPDVIWPARWYLPAGQGNYDPNASVWDIGKCVPVTAWNNHQRIRQYAGDHSETWGGMPLNSIDDDVLDGVVAVPFFGTPSPDFSAAPLSNPPLTVRFTITNTAFLSTCAWEYGDGQTGTSCDFTHTHTYASPGTYTVSLTVSSSWGAENLTSSTSITVDAYRVFLPLVISH